VAGGRRFDRALTSSEPAQRSSIDRAVPFGVDRSACPDAIRPKLASDSLRYRRVGTAVHEPEIGVVSTAISRLVHFRGEFGCDAVGAECIHRGVDARPLPKIRPNDPASSSASAVNGSRDDDATKHVVRTGYRTRWRAAAVPHRATLRGDRADVVGQPAIPAGVAGRRRTVRMGKDVVGAEVAAVVGQRVADGVDARISL